LIHTGINYYYFQDAISTLVESAFSKNKIMKLLNEGKESIMARIQLHHNIKLH
jgi:hypothetical protein